MEKEITTEQKPLISAELKAKLLQNQHHYYNQTYVLFEMLKCLKGHTLDVLSPNSVEEKKMKARYFYATTFDFLKKHFEVLGISKGDKLINIYRSIAHFPEDSLKFFGYNMKTRKESAEYQNFSKNMHNIIDGFDFLVDIDSESLQHSYEIAKEIKKEIFDEYKLPYFIKNSGRKGFHIQIPSEFISYKGLETINKIQKIVRNLGVVYDYQKQLDASPLFHAGLIKLAYSFDASSNCISMPLSDEEFDKFTPEMVLFENVVYKKAFNIKNRGLLIRKWNLSDAELKANVKRFMGEYLE
jgi:hypothetical protein